VAARVGHGTGVPSLAEHQSVSWDRAKEGAPGVKGVRVLLRVTSSTFILSARAA